MNPPESPKDPEAFRDDVSLEETELAVGHILGPEQGRILSLKRGTILQSSSKDHSTKGSACAEARNNCNVQERSTNKA